MNIEGYATRDIPYGPAELSLKGSRARSGASAVLLRFAHRPIATNIRYKTRPLEFGKHDRRTIGAQKLYKTLSLPLPHIQHQRAQNTKSFLSNPNQDLSLYDRVDEVTSFCILVQTCCFVGYFAAELGVIMEGGG